MKPHPDKSSYFPWFDWLRACCAIVVMLGHTGAITIPNAGNFAVQVFFALSGWLIGRILLDTVPSGLPRFFFNRAIRIWIPYFLAVALLLLLSVLREPITSKWIEIVVYKLTFVYNIFGTRQLETFRDLMPQKGTLSHVWSVNAEEQFYLIAPIFLVLLKKWGGASRPAWGILALVTWYLDLYASIAFGVFAAVLFPGSPGRQTNPIWRLVFAACLVASALALTLGSPYPWVAPVAAVSIVLLLAIPGRQHRFGELWGGMSYPLYLNHWIGVFALNYLLPSLKGSLVHYVLSTCLNLFFAMLLYVAVDKRLLAQRGNWYLNQRGMVLMFSAYAVIMIGTAFGLAKWE